MNAKVKYYLEGLTRETAMLAYYAGKISEVNSLTEYRSQLEVVQYWFTKLVQAKGEERQAQEEVNER